MIINTSQVTKILITKIERLDDITVILEDIGPHQGRIIIECYGESWASYWGGMGERTIAEFFCSCDEYYLAKNLSSISSTILDYDGLANKIKNAIIRSRRKRELSKFGAKWACEQADDIVDESSAAFNHKFIAEHLGDEWWREFPVKTNPDYEYLCRIITTVQQALREVNIKEAA
ncbi:MAG: hypothetical protein HUJ30_05195 [Gammaproteobacteria bacterium]|nr:hypothetical protein [Gammaproteobacteria bacterium]